MENYTYTINSSPPKKTTEEKKENIQKINRFALKWWNYGVAPLFSKLCILYFLNNPHWACVSSTVEETWKQKMYKEAIKK